MPRKKSPTHDYDISTGTGQKRLMAESVGHTYAPAQRIENTPGDYGADPLGPDENGVFHWRMVPSGEIVDKAEHDRRLTLVTEESLTDTALQTICEAINARDKAAKVAEVIAAGWVALWTTAPADYDTFGTTVAEQCGAWRGGALRKVLAHPHHATYQADRYGSGLHGTWREDPRIEERMAAERAERWRAEDAARAAARAVGMAWVRALTDAELDAAIESDDLGTHGIEYRDARDERRRREAERAEAQRAAEWERCRAAFADGAILVDDGSPGERGIYGWIPGRPPHVYYAAQVADDWAKVADDARVVDAAGELVGSLALVAGYLASGRLRVVEASDVPPEPVTRRIGHDRYREIARVQVGDRVLWVGRPIFAPEPFVLDERGRLVSGKRLRATALQAYAASPKDMQPADERRFVTNAINTRAKGG